MKLRTAVIGLLCLLGEYSAVGSQVFTFSARGRTYTITTTKRASQALVFSGHWLYQPSVITPSSLTGNKYVMLFSSNRIASSSSDQAIFYTSSTTGYSGFSAPQEVLRMSLTSNICDMIDARPFWDGSIWHVYVQAREWVSGSCPNVNYVFEATGTTLTSLSWLYDFSNHARRVLMPRPGSAPGIGEDHQWAFTTPYLGPPTYPISIFYNDWNYVGQDCKPFNPQGTYNCFDYCPNCAFNGTDLFSYLSPNGTSPVYFWYYREAAYGPAANPDKVQHYPDVLLGDSLDAATKGNPALGFQSRCKGTTDRYQHSRGVGFYPDPVPYNRLPQGGAHHDGTLEAWTNDSLGGFSEARMFRPRVARNEHGYLAPFSNSPKKWKSFIYYTDSQIYAGSDPCGGGYTNWTGSQWFSVSDVEITEQ